MSVTVQHVNTTFCVLLEKSPSETLQIIEVVYGKEAMKKTHIHRGHKRFCDGHERANVDPHCGQPSAKTNEKTSNMCGMLCNMPNERVFRIYQRKQEYQLKAFILYFT
jgi:hypothetical protein